MATACMERTGHIGYMYVPTEHPVEWHTCTCIQSSKNCWIQKSASAWGLSETYHISQPVGTGINPPPPSGGEAGEETRGCQLLVAQGTGLDRKVLVLLTLLFPHILLLHGQEWTQLCRLYAWKMTNLSQAMASLWKRRKGCWCLHLEHVRSPPPPCNAST